MDKRVKRMYQTEVREGKVYYTDQTEQVRFSVDEKNFAGMASIKDMEPITDPAVYQNSINHPDFGESLEQIARKKKAKSACVLISDATRSVPTKFVAGILTEKLCSVGIPEQNIVFIVATGVHREATEKEMMEFVGEGLYRRVRVINHDPYTPDRLVYIGETTRKTPVKVNKTAYQCDLHIVVGKVEPHEFAGFSGGRKSVLPGISSEETIWTNHAPQMIGSKKAVPGVLEGNPVHEDMLESAKLFGVDFSVQFVVNQSLEAARIFCGGLEDAHNAAVSFLRKQCGVMIRKRPDIIVTTPGSPLNIDFYQSLKPLIALTEILDERITVVLYCECPEGVNSTDMLVPFAQSRDLGEIEKFTMENYKIQMDHSLLLLKILKKKVKIIVSSPNVSDEDISLMGMIPCKDREKLMDFAFDVCGKPDPKVLFYPQPQKGLPVLAD